MSEKTDDIRPAGDADARPPSPHSSRRRWKLFVGVAAGAAVIAAGLAAIVIARDDDDDPAPESEVATVRDACRQWLADEERPSGAGPGPGWCDDMAGLMSDLMAGGHMRGHMMGDSPEALGDACRQAMETYRGADGEPGPWCDEMVGWMSRHMDRWDGRHHWDDD